jgi:hypothetical protein
VPRSWHEHARPRRDRAIAVNDRAGWHAGHWRCQATGTAANRRSQ